MLKFTEQFQKSGSTKKTNYTAVDKSTLVKGWLEDVASDIMENKNDKYANIYKTAKEAADKHTNEVEIASYYIRNPSSCTRLPPLSDLSVEEIARVVEEQKMIEITMEDKDNPFDGCRLKLHPLYSSPQGLKIEDNSNASAMVLMAVT